MKDFKLVISNIVTAIIIITIALLKQYGSLEDTLTAVTKWYNNNVAIANTTGIMAFVTAFGLSFVNSKLRQKEQTINVEVGSNNEKVEKLANNIINLDGRMCATDEKIEKLIDLLYTFADGTKIEPYVKKDLAKIYASPVSKSKPILEKAKEVIETTVEEVKEVVKETNVYEQIKNSINNK